MLKNYLEYLNENQQYKDSAICDLISKSDISNLDGYDKLVQDVKNMINAGVDVDYQDSNGYNAIMLDVEKQEQYCTSGGDAKFDTRIFEMLVAAGADLCLRNKDGETFWDMRELYGGDEEVRKIRLSHGSSVSKNSTKQSFSKRIKNVLKFYKDQKNVKDFEILELAEKYNL